MRLQNSRACTGKTSTSPPVLLPSAHPTGALLHGADRSTRPTSPAVSPRSSARLASAAEAPRALGCRRSRNLKPPAAIAGSAWLVLTFPFESGSKPAATMSASHRVGGMGSRLLLGRPHYRDRTISTEPVHGKALECPPEWLAGSSTLRATTGSGYATHDRSVLCTAFPSSGYQLRRMPRPAHERPSRSQSAED